MLHKPFVIAIGCTAVLLFADHVPDARAASAYNIVEIERVCLFPWPRARIITLYIDLDTGRAQRMERRMGLTTASIDPIAEGMPTLRECRPPPEHLHSAPSEDRPARVVTVRCHDRNGAERAIQVAIDARRSEDVRAGPHPAAPYLRLVPLRKGIPSRTTWFHFPCPSSELPSANRGEPSP